MYCNLRSDSSFFTLRCTAKQFPPFRKRAGFHAGRLIFRYFRYPQNFSSSVAGMSLISTRHIPTGSRRIVSCISGCVMDAGASSSFSGVSSETDVCTSPIVVLPSHLLAYFSCILITGKTGTAHIDHCFTRSQNGFRLFSIHLFHFPYCLRSHNGGNSVFSAGCKTVVQSRNITKIRELIQQNGDVLGQRAHRIHTRHDVSRHGMLHAEHRHQNLLQRRDL